MGVDVEYMHRRAQHHASTGNAKIHHSRLQAKRMKAVHRARKLADDNGGTIKDHIDDAIKMDDPFETWSMGWDGKAISNVMTEAEIKALIDSVSSGLSGEEKECIPVEKEPCEEDDEECLANQDEVECEEPWEINLVMLESSFYGVIDGLSSVFTSSSCTGGMANVVDSGFRAVENIEIYLPEKTMKFFMSTNNFTDATNTVVAWCDFNGVGNKLAKLTNFRQYENYVRLAGRVGGVFIADWEPNYQCIEEGWEAEVGHDVGLCVARITSLMLDAIL